MSPRRALIVPALLSEAKAILSFFEDISVKSAPSGVSFTTGKLKLLSSALGRSARNNWTFFIATPTAAGNLQASRAVGQMIPECRPDLIAMIGCAGGFPGKIDQFDVTVATQVDYIARSKVGSHIEIRPLQEFCSRTFVDHCKNVQLLDVWHQYLAPETSNAPINVYFEPIVSGETVLVNSNSDFFRAAVIASPRAVAIEMEGYGFLSACRDQHIEGVVIRGISDTLDNKYEQPGNSSGSILGIDRAQLKATRHAAALFFATLDFVDPSVFSNNRPKSKKEVTKVSMILDAEMHDVSQIQSELFEIFKKYGIKNFSFKQANSIRVEFDAQTDVMRIYASLIRVGVVKDLAGHAVLKFSVQLDNRSSDQLSLLIKRIEALGTATTDELLHAIRIENWIEEFPDYTKILIDTLKQHRQNHRRGPRKKTPRILYALPPTGDQRAEHEQYFGPISVRSDLNLQSADLNRQLLDRVAPKAPNDLVRWFLGDHILDHDINLDTLLTHSKRRLFYSWPNLAAVQLASSTPMPEFVDICIAEWKNLRGASGPSILQILDQGHWDRLGKGQVRDAIEGRPATLSKAIDLLALTCRILSQSNLPPRGCIIASLYTLTFNGVIAGDGVVERMLLTGMAGDLQSIADANSIPLNIFQSAIRGSLLTYQCATDLAKILNGSILNATKLRCDMVLLDPDGSRPGREAVDLTATGMAERYVVPRAN